MCLFQESKLVGAEGNMGTKVEEFDMGGEIGTRTLFPKNQPPLTL